MARLAAGLAHRALGRGPGLGGHLHEGEHRNATELDLTGRTVNEQDHAGDLSARGLDEIDRLLDASALGDDVFGNHIAFALLDLEAAHREDGVGLARRVHAFALDLLSEHALDVDLTATSCPTRMPPTAGLMTPSIFFPSLPLLTA